MAERVLVVDDEAGNRELLEAILTEDGYLVEQADNGVRALAQATAAPPDLILLDLMMPGMSGLEVCRRLKGESVTAAVPVIVVTALGQMKDMEAALTAGADDFLTKPLDRLDLRTRVSAMLKVRRIRQDLDRTLAYLHELEAARHARRHAALASVIGGPPPSPPPPLSAPVILLVDDGSLSCRFYGDLLGEHGLQVLSASSSAAGLELARGHAVDVVVLEIMMPEMSGLEVLERLHAQDPDLPVIMLTAHASSQNAVAALKLGAFDFIVKGLDPNLIVLATHRAVRHRRETLAKRQEIAQLRARIAELEATRPGQ